MLLWILAPTIEKRLKEIFAEHVAPRVKGGMSTEKLLRRQGASAVFQ